MADRDATLTYDGTTYRFAPAVADGLVARGVIEVDGPGTQSYRLSLDHTIDELEGLGEVIAHADAPSTPRLRMFDRNGGLFGRQGIVTRRLYVFEATVVADRGTPTRDSVAGWPSSYVTTTTALTTAWSAIAG